MDELILKSSFIQCLGKVNNGVSLLFSLTLTEFSFESIYWIHPEGHCVLEIDPQFLKLFGVIETEKLPFYKELIQDIESHITNKEEIFAEYI